MLMHIVSSKLTQLKAVWYIHSRSFISLLFWKGIVNTAGRDEEIRARGRIEINESGPRLDPRFFCFELNSSLFMSLQTVGGYNTHTHTMSALFLCALKCTNILGIHYVATYKWNDENKDNDTFIYETCSSSITCAAFTLNKQEVGRDHQLCFCTPPSSSTHLSFKPLRTPCLNGSVALLFIYVFSTQ